jgi:hypothetical protein
MSTATDFSSIVDAINRLADAVDEQTSVLRNIGATLDDSVDVKREMLELLRSQDGEAPTEIDDSKLTDDCTCPGCNVSRLIDAIKSSKRQHR